MRIFFHKCRTLQRILNQAEGSPPLGSSRSSGPATNSITGGETERQNHMNPLIQLRQTTSVFLVAFGLTCFGPPSAVQAVTPAPDGGYPNFNTAEGTNALFSLTSGTNNTA